MRIIDLILMGLRNLMRRKARTILTVIGVMIGTLSIVIMVSIGIGMDQSFKESIMENGSMTIINVSASSYEVDDDGNWSRKDQKLDDEVVKQLRAIEHVKGVTPILYCWDAQFYSGKYYSWPNLMIMDMDCYETFGYPPLEDGTYPNKEKGKNTFFFGPESVDSFYYWSGRNTLTKTIDINKDKIEMRFSGYETNARKKEFSYVIPNKQKIQRSESGYSESDYYIFVDIDTYREIFTRYAKTLKIADRKTAMKRLEEYENIRINVDNMDNVTAVQDAITALGYNSDSDMEYIEPLQETARMIELVLAAIGGVALLVSAINIANTMIMAIYERTREIGIMKVLGCKVSDVRKLFLFESGMIGLIGGIVGIGLSYLCSWAMNKYGADVLGSFIGTGSGGVSVIPFWLPFVAALFSFGIGVVFGFIPALRATRISAIEAMKTAE